MSPVPSLEPSFMTRISAPGTAALISSKTLGRLSSSLKAGTITRRPLTVKGKSLRSPAAALRAKRLGLPPQSLLERSPRLIVKQLSRPVRRGVGVRDVPGSNGEKADWNRTGENLTQHFDHPKEGHP